ncbi:MAG: hypothetical protein ACI4HI_17055 [Lachnospiraceae bacterium]
MESIDQYIQKIRSDFQKNIEKQTQLCELRDCGFSSGHLPDYTNEQVQRYYLLRFTIAYVYEYKMMYEQMLQLLPNFNGTRKTAEKIRVFSVGAGAKQDYWSLASAIEESAYASESSIEYTAVDLIKWSDQFQKREIDQRYSFYEDVLGYLDERFAFSEDVFFFPKSISEFSNADFQKILKKIRETPFLKQEVCLGVSMRYTTQNLEDDRARTNALIKAFQQAGFQISASVSYNLDQEPRKEKITTIDDKKYNELMNYIKNLKSYCTKKNCRKDACNIDRAPIHWTDKLRWQVIKFEKSVRERR